MIVATLIFLAPSAALESQNKPTCDCTKRSAELVLEGGDSAPLKFYSLRNMLQPPNGNEPAWFCYERSVTNHSGADVPDVTWKVAAYEKDKIKPGRPVCDHSTVPGTSTNENGVVEYGPGNRRYSSAASYKPTAGWPAVAGQSSTLAAPSKPLPLEAAIQLWTPAGQFTEVILRSTLQVDGKASIFTYEVNTKSEEPLHVYWDIPQWPDLATQFQTPEKPFVVSQSSFAKGQVISQVSTAIPGWRLATVVIADRSDEVILARGVAAAYGSMKGQSAANGIFRREIR